MLIPLRWHPFWCFFGLHNPVYGLDDSLERGEITYVCWHCLKVIS